MVHDRKAEHTAAIVEVSSHQVGVSIMRENWEGWGLWGLVALGVGQLKTKSSHGSCLASDFPRFPPFPLLIIIIRIPSLGKQYSLLQYEEKNFPLPRKSIMLGWQISTPLGSSFLSLGLSLLDEINNRMHLGSTSVLETLI